MAYARYVSDLVKDQWTMPPTFRTSGELVVVVELNIDAGGVIYDFRVVRASGVSEYDASAMRAVSLVRNMNLRPPPGRLNFTITFNSREG
ncbi:MAG: TonB C-terminal domain-containing protein [Desulfovibrio sp.]|nr:MAG: TonB C-terminal domain-containing protein [Desulfovibrio sp.]